jgi:hypothetical protein
MGQLNEFIARAANKEDGVKGRFWEGRFKCQVLIDEAAIAACMVYVDLNPIRAGLAGTPEESDFTSIQKRIHAWQKDAASVASIPQDEPQNTQTDLAGEHTGLLDNPVDIPDTKTYAACTRAVHFDGAALSACWLCPIQSNSQRRGILRMTTAEYIDLVDRSGRTMQQDKRGAIDADLAPILLRIGANPEAWGETVSHFGTKFRLAAGLMRNLRRFADQLGRRWLTGVAAARVAFASAPPIFDTP